MCKSNSNGNAGHRYVKCHIMHPNGLQCNYFRWCTPCTTPTMSQASSPILGSPTPHPPTTAQTLDSVSAVLIASIPQSDTPGQCAYPGCGVVRIHSACTHRRCRKHCLKVVGCAVKDHNDSWSHEFAAQSAAAPPMLLPGDALPSIIPQPHDLAVHPAPAAVSISAPLPDGAVPGIAPLWILDPESASTQANGKGRAVEVPAPGVEATTSSGPSNTQTHTTTRPTPHYTSQMPPILTNQIAKEQALCEEQRSLEAQRIANLQKAKHHVIVYCWHTVHLIPNVCGLVTNTGNYRTTLTQSSLSFKVAFNGRCFLSRIVSSQSCSSVRTVIWQVCRSTSTTDQFAYGQLLLDAGPTGEGGLGSNEGAVEGR